LRPKHVITCRRGAFVHVALDLFIVVFVLLLSYDCEVALPRRHGRRGDISARRTTPPVPVAPSEA